MKRLPLGLQSFRKIIEGGYVYVDKTQYVYELVNGDSYYFLSRPRRFGKSLLLDTIGEAFGGDRELFKGLFLYESDYAFEKHPVVRLDMSSVSNDTPETLRNSLSMDLRKRIKEESLDIDGETPTDLLKNLIEALYRKHGKGVVVLIDEYDKPILDNLDDMPTAETNRKILRSLYGVLKSLDTCLRFAFIAGITKFTKTSVFSGLNNLRDITMSRKYSNICGIPTDELGKYFGEHIERLASSEELECYGNITDEILSWYDGYSWDAKTRVINPFALLSFITEERFVAFWFASGTPKFLMDLVKKDSQAYISLNNKEIAESDLDTAELDALQAGPLMFQTGYLTVKEISRLMDDYVYRLEMPNREVRKAFYSNMLAAIAEKNQPNAKRAQLDLERAFLKNDMQKMLDTLRGLYASIPYDIHVDLEAYYHSIFYAIANSLGFDIKAEVPVSGGRVDVVLDIGNRAYVIEFKYRKCPAKASKERKRILLEKALDEGMDQIKNRGYANKYIGSGKTVYKIAVAILGRDNMEMRIEEV